MTYVSMKEFLRNGMLGSVTLGLTRSQVQELVGPPEEVSSTLRSNSTPLIWKYGDIELHFVQPSDRLSLIYLENFDVPTGGQNIEVDPWIIRGGVERETVEEYLRSYQIIYHYVDALEPDQVRVIVEAGVVLTFIEGASDDMQGLYSISFFQL